MIGWQDEWVDEWINLRMRGWLYEWVDEWMTLWMSRWMDDPMNELVISVIHQFLNNEPAVPIVFYSIDNIEGEEEE